MIINILTFDEKHDVKRLIIKISEEKKLKNIHNEQKQKIMIKIKINDYNNIYYNSNNDNYDDNYYFYFYYYDNV